jgi:hypothetical protein
VRWALERGYDPCELPRTPGGGVWPNALFQYRSWSEVRKRCEKAYTGRIPAWVYPIYAEAVMVFGRGNIRVYCPDPQEFHREAPDRWCRECQQRVYRIKGLCSVCHARLPDPMLIATWREGRQVWHFRLAVWGIEKDLKTLAKEGVHANAEGHTV